MSSPAPALPPCGTAAPTSTKAAAKNAKRRAKRRDAHTSKDSTSAVGDTHGGLPSPACAENAAIVADAPAEGKFGAIGAMEGAGPLVDIGANLTHRQLASDLPGLLRRAAAAGVSRIIITGTSLKSSRAALQTCRDAPQDGVAGRGDGVPPGCAGGNTIRLACTAGVHPHEAKSCNAASIPALRDLAVRNSDVVCAIGECGLDYNRNFSPAEVQREWFRRQVNLACELSLPLFVHERDAHEDFLAVLQPFLSARAPRPVSVTHALRC